MSTRQEYDRSGECASVQFENHNLIIVDQKSTSFCEKKITFIIKPSNSSLHDANEKGNIFRSSTEVGRKLFC